MYRNVLIAVDQDTAGKDAIALAQLLAGAETRFTLGHVESPIRGVGAAPGQQERQRATKILRTAREHARIAAELRSCRDPDVGRGLRALAAATYADLIVVGTLRRGPVGRFVVADAALQTLQGAHCDVAVAPREYARHGHPLRTVGVGYSGSRESRRALLAARRIADERQLEVVALRATRPVAAPDRLGLGGAHADVVDQLAGTQVTAAPGPAAQALISLSAEVDLLCLGSHADGPLGQIARGPVIDQLVRRTHCPLLRTPRGRRAPGEPATTLHDGVALPR